ncbi:peptidyl-prolyl cis-trans isomerase [Desertibacillus haloalkaliphilus]|uniref:peptidyl-prolyl cis-trans isomerase n=1 Tax=Desertibacillus haloalkaliphilus TaxID=1328930 RepID=UPI001C26435A|nr:peptidyl-prolyl cis-trans isomerase [Desertibacillus haloalkaliphilus]MBU8906727.1 peptidyl-prolyl cis-trans isomerase [Desertibacillus haloalkaliphilus]
MEFIIDITGDVDHPLTIDPSVWIFDERKVDLDTYFDTEREDELTAYKKAISAQWDREITEGSKPPSQTNENQIDYNKQQLMNGSFGMRLEPFLKNAKPNENATIVSIETADNSTVDVAIDKAYSLILGFSYKGKPLKDDGPVHIYFDDGSNRDQPIKNVLRLRVK